MSLSTISTNSSTQSTELLQARLDIHELRGRNKDDNYYKDRVWDWGCCQVTKDPLGDCSWSSGLNTIEVCIVMMSIL